MKGSPDEERYLEVDPVLCDGYGYCAELLPELVTLDDWGFPMIARRALSGSLGREAEALVRACPKLALRISARPAKG